MYFFLRCVEHKEIANSPDPVDRIQQHQHLRHGQHTDADYIPRANAMGNERLCTLLDSAVQLFIGDLLSEIIDGRAIHAVFIFCDHVVIQASLRQRGVDGFLTVIFQPRLVY